MRSRYYSPSTGRFTQRDSFLGFYSDPLSLNRYLYCSHNPIKYRDPWGDWQKGDEEYDLATQDELMAATQAYYTALERDDRDGMKAAQAAAQAARDAGTKGAHPAGVTPGSIYTDAITNSTHGYMTLADFKAADKEIIATSGQWTYYYTLLAIQATQNLDKLYPDVKTHNNLGLLAKGQGPQNQDLFALKNYWWLYDNVFKNKNSSHIMVNDEHYIAMLKTISSTNLEALNRWYVDTSGRPFDERYKGMIKNNPSDAIMVNIKGDTITVNANIWFTGTPFEKEPTTNTFYRTLVTSGIKDLWEGEYWMNGQWVKLEVEFVEGVFGAGRNVVTININTEQIVRVGADAYNENFGSWSKGGNKFIRMYAYKKVDEGSGIYTADHFKRTSAHEFGHSLGIWDYYETYDKNTGDIIMYGVPESIVAKNDLMRVTDPSASVYSKTVSVMLDAMSKNISQELRKMK